MKSVKALRRLLLGVSVTYPSALPSTAVTVLAILLTAAAPLACIKKADFAKRLTPLTTIIT